MPIHLFAVGSGGFEYRLTSVSVGEVFEMANVASIMTAPTRAHRAIATVDAQANTSAAERLLTAGSDMIHLHHFRDTCGLFREAGDIILSFSFRSSNLMWVDDSAHRSFRLTNRMANPAWHILNRIQPAMLISMQGTGVLMSIAIVFNSYMQHERLPGGSPFRNPDRPMTYRGDARLNFQFTD